MAGVSKKSKKSSVAKKVLSFDEADGAMTRRGVGGTKGVVPPRAAPTASGRSTSSAKDGPAQRSIRQVKMAAKTTTTDGNETESTVSSLGDSGGEESDFEIEARAKISKNKKGRAAVPKVDKAVKAKAPKASSKVTGKGAAAAKKPKAEKKPRASKRNIKSVLEEEYAVPSPKKLRASTANATAYGEVESGDDADCTTPGGIRLFPDSPKTEDWRLAAAIDY
jgi:hypothetical protein